MVDQLQPRLQLILGVVVCVLNDLSSSMVDFCYKNEFPPSDKFELLKKIPLIDITHEFVVDRMNIGAPFVVSQLTHDWKRTERWTHAYFEELFADSELFSSTFSTLDMPTFSSNHTMEEVYFGVFLNDEKLSEKLRTDYQYPNFIPEEWRNIGNEWIHWGYPPCGARRHMDLMCTSRISVQVKGAKKWRLYPIVAGTDLDLHLSNWSEVLKPAEVTLWNGDGLVWFPGWEHETHITEGPSVSLSLHFDSPSTSVYQNNFHHELTERVSQYCNWHLA
ncbi:uncharacterized protein [Dysidea avara]|uniref:uncharacterized protein isoform X2 n=1 Tax=Dysidea avara TaxID=196820 RepID=UPI003330F303